MPNPTPTLDPDENVPVETRAMLGIFALYWRMDDAFSRQELTNGLGRVECYLLMQLKCPRRMGELAKLLLLVPSSVTSAADRLEQEGLAVRVRDAGDRRAFQLQLTADGRALRAALEERAGRAFRDMCGLNEDEIQQFSILSDKIKEKILESANQQPGKER